MAHVLPLVPGSALGIVANPMSGRDIRRLVARASVFPNAEKINMVLRVVEAAGALGIETVHVSTDTMGLAAGVLRESGRRTGNARWPALEFSEPDVLHGTAADTRAHVREMVRRGVGAIVVLGGDGTVRAAASGLIGGSGDLPVLPLSTGTNNAFPEMWEATVAGTAAALVASGRVADADATYRAKSLTVAAGERTENALVDVCVNTALHVGSRALWEVGTLRELYCTFGEPHAIGLSSVVGQARPTGRRDRGGVRLTLAADAEHEVLAPIAPGVLAPVGIVAVEDLRPEVPARSAVRAGTVAVDGEREIEFGPADTVTITLRHDGPCVIDVRQVLAVASRDGLLSTRARGGALMTTTDIASATAGQS